MTPCRWMLLLFALCLMWGVGSSWWRRRRRRRCDSHSCQWKWSACSKTCGGGTKYAIKTRQQGSCGRCDMPSGRFSCNPRCCPKNCYWSSWGSWSSCSRSCGGGGVRTRTRRSIGPSCGGASCRGPSSQSQSCYTRPCPVDCSWSSWSGWSHCSSSCGGGNQYRSRNHAIKAQHGGKVCVGSPRQQQSCNKGCCPVDCVWGKWGNWEQCSASCGQGNQLRRRGQTTVQSCGGRHCRGEAIESRKCDAGCCPTNCKWQKWSDWSKCSRTCGIGSQYRGRLRSVLDVCGGIQCVGPDRETRSCNETCCVTDCQWGSWGEWGNCSKSCDLGTHLRTRKVAVEASCGGRYCRGDNKDKSHCNAFCCEEHCHWDEWAQWGRCSKSCGEGKQTRFKSVRIDRDCKIQRCPGKYNDVRICNEGCCPVDCELSLWTHWSECSSHCGGSGLKNRSRNITKQMQCGGIPCGELSEEKECNRLCFNNGTLNGICYCEPGWKGDCCEKDVDECEETDICPENSACFNTHGSYKCVCNQNFTKEGKACIPMTACHWGTHDCHEKAQCMSINENYICECEPGFTGNGTSCFDVDECATDEEAERILDRDEDIDYAQLLSGDNSLKPPLCLEDAVCVNTYGSYECQCETGYAGNGSVCHDIDECAQPVSVCSEHATCKNTAGSYQCVCNAGYHGDGSTCEEINECDSDPCKNGGECKDLSNSFECSCTRGYSGLTCEEDVDECEKYPCSIHSTCHNSHGSYNCLCDRGYIKNGTVCDDLDECALPRLSQEDAEIVETETMRGLNEPRPDMIYNPCHIHANCMNFEGGYSCKCKHGYNGNGNQCTDTDECALGYHSCKSEHEKCLNIDGGFECECEDGYEMKDGRCADTDECASGSHSCNELGQVCQNTEGGFSCVCAEGFELKDGECKDIDECATKDYNCHLMYQKCVNKEGGYECVCDDGFQMKDGGCQEREPEF